MAWWAADFAGSVQNTSKILRDLCGALNEREALLNRALSIFFIGNGTTKPNPTEADFDGFPLYANLGLNPSWMTQNIGSLRTGIENLFIYNGSPQNEWSLFVQPNRTRWTLADLLDLGSFGDSWLTVTRINDQNGYQIWEQLREAFDQMRYVVWFPIFRWIGPSGSIGGHQFNLRGGVGSTAPLEASAEQAWDNAKADTPAATGLPGFFGPGGRSSSFAWWEGHPRGEFPFYDASLSNDNWNSLDTHFIHGAVTKGIVVMGTTQSVGTLDEPVEFTWEEGPATYNVESGDVGTEVTEHDAGTFWPTLPTFGVEFELDGGIDDSVLTLNVASGRGADLPDTPFTFNIEGEKIRCDTVAGDTLSDLERARHGSSAAAHADEEEIENFHSVMSMTITGPEPDSIPSDLFPDVLPWIGMADIVTLLAGFPPGDPDPAVTRIYTDLDALLIYIT